ncbi:ABC transporter ATP-binding protein [Herbiconiux sp. KACC 21604]|uniref:ABC transporter ATP-binding protein n=1 Tax=unclassified Herbiconiux TaxID=2618217 RepID=UPI001491E723|nr:ABC transporter ATP-binding protein [Herbiconiux sp. SALV-R1]QJU53894.1 ABC transporter ATP-binding protein [Herbiconiux sp. SALV-R1]WPO84912.1 ABC transporter ATP-binding protein [Herbiconiux sp. KACC 21604]
MSERDRAGALLSVDAVDVSYGRGRAERRVLKGVSLEVAPGEAVGLIGETGSGKTTLARTVLGLTRLTSGSVRFDGATISGLRGRALREVRRSGALQYVFQDPLLSLDPDLTVRASIAEGLLLRGGLGRDAVDAAVARALAAVGLDRALLERLPAQLSGGQRQRVVIARALAVEPRLLLLDEPVSALDAANRIQVLDLLRRLGRENGIAQLFISHDLGSVAGVADRIAVLYHGEIVETGATREVIARPQHPYTRLLIGSATTLSGGGVDRETRGRLRRELAAHSALGS